MLLFKVDAEDYEVEVEKKGIGQSSLDITKQVKCDNDWRYK